MVHIYDLGNYLVYKEWKRKRLAGKLCRDMEKDWIPSWKVKKILASCDIETRGLNCQKFILGSLVTEKHKNPMLFRNKDDMWNRILELGRSERKRGKVLNLYAHNAKFDFYGYAKLTDPGISIFCNRPFIASYRENGKEIIRFLDTLAIYQMTLKELGDLIDYPKWETPEELLIEDDRVIPENTLKRIEKYCVRDSEICLKAIQHERKQNKADGVNIKVVFTKSQRSARIIMNKLAKRSDSDHLFEFKDIQKTVRTKFPELIHKAYRGGRVEAFKTGVFPKVNGVDKKSAYTKGIMSIKCPILKTERKINHPLDIIKMDVLLNKIGLSRAIIYNESNDLGLMPIRTGDGNYFPKSGKYVVGTWTHRELAKCLEEGYKILNIEWSIIWDEGVNCFAPIYKEIYDLKESATNPFNRQRYKDIMNHSIGKFAQYRPDQEYIIDSVEMVEQYLEKNYCMVNGIGYNYVYKKDNSNAIIKQKAYYMPIISVLTNAENRCAMYDEYKKIPLGNLLYTDTDSVYYLENGRSTTFSIGKNPGQMEVTADQKEMVIYGRKTYMIDESIKISGANARTITPKQFKKGLVSSKKMLTLMTTKDLEKVGTFIEEQRDLFKQLENHKKITEELDKQDIYVDSDIEDITFFLKDLNKRNI